MKKLVVLTGAGISKESGIDTFRDSGGLWDNYSVEDVASIQGWQKDQKIVLDFYNKRRRELKTVEPNSAHIDLAKLEKDYDVHIVTQNVDNLHERGGSTSILHLHGELTKSRSSTDSNLVYNIDGDINIGDRCEKGSQLRPYIVWFGEDVPKLNDAANLVANADILVIIGTSMSVYPAANLVNWAKRSTPIFFIDPSDVILPMKIKHIKDVATNGVKILINELKKI